MGDHVGRPCGGRFFARSNRRLPSGGNNARVRCQRLSKVRNARGICSNLSLSLNAWQFAAAIFSGSLPKIENSFSPLQRSAAIRFLVFLFLSSATQHISAIPQEWYSSISVVGFHPSMRVIGFPRTANACSVDASSMNASKNTGTGRLNFICIQAGRYGDGICRRFSPGHCGCPARCQQNLNPIRFFGRPLYRVLKFDPFHQRAAPDDPCACFPER